MRAIILLFFVTFSTLLANSTLLVKSGWQLIGLTESIEDMSIFDNGKVNQVWAYDASNGAWRGYAPDSAVQSKINNSYQTLTSLKRWQGFWVYSKEDWALTTQNSATPTAPQDINVTLEAGWNLISLPIDCVVSPELFKDHIVWKYRSDSWQFFEQNSTYDGFNRIHELSNSDGFWVYSDVAKEIPIADHLAALHTLENDVEMENYIREMAMVNQRPYYGYFIYDDTYMVAEIGNVAISDAVVSGSGTDTSNDASQESVTNATGTNLQEADVDESDIVKHNGNAIFFINKGVDFYGNQYNRISYTTFDTILSGASAPIGSIEIDLNKTVDSMYIHGDTLIVLSHMYNYKTSVSSGEMDVSMPIDDYWYGYAQNSQVAVDLYTIADLENITKIEQFTIDGTLEESRLTDGKLVLISSFIPTIEIDYPKLYPDYPECKALYAGTVEYIESDFDTAKYMRCYNLAMDSNNRLYTYDYDNPLYGDAYLIPTIQIGDTKAPLISSEDFYVPSKLNQSSTITTVSRIDIDSASLLNSSSIIGKQKDIYATSNSLYIISHEYPYYYDYTNYQERSSIYQFDLNDTLAYKAMGFVNGRTLDQFSLSEYDNVLRVATSEGNSWQANTTNSIYALQLQNGYLNTIGHIGSLGHEGELIYAVRFIAEKAFVVTFRQTDPFYTLDLSDPTQMQVVGELEVPGYSSYLHPVSEDLVLGIGRDAKNVLKLELFNVADFANPASVSLYTFPQSVYYTSEAEYNHKALSYRDSDDLFVMPLNGGYYNYASYLSVFGIDNNQIKAYAPIENNIAYSSYWNMQRGIIFDKEGQTYIAYIVNGAAKAVSLESLNQE